ncbi:hypothetical protein KGO95_02035 [Patescibacteria group bacterium]|nr:hypothetical protein [Patescibacteria group bacterium]
MSSRSKKVVITYDHASAKFVVKAMGYEVDRKGFVIDGKTRLRVLANDKRMIRIEEVGGICKGPDGNPQLVRNDLSSLIRLADALG